MKDASQCWMCAHPVTSEIRICPRRCGCHAHYAATPQPDAPATDGPTTPEPTP